MLILGVVLRFVLNQWRMKTLSWVLIWGYSVTFGILVNQWYSMTFLINWLIPNDEIEIYMWIAFNIIIYTINQSFLLWIFLLLGVTYISDPISSYCLEFGSFSLRDISYLQSTYSMMIMICIIPSPSSVSILG